MSENPSEPTAEATQPATDETGVDQASAEMERYASSCVR